MIAKLLGGARRLVGGARGVLRMGASRNRDDAHGFMGLRGREDGRRARLVSSLHTLFA